MDGCARVIWNAKCDEDRYLRSFAQKYLPVGTYPPIDKAYSQYKTELTPWLSECPSQILRNSATIWADTYQKFLKGACGLPRRKRRDGTGYLWLTKELFRLEKNNGLLNKWNDAGKFLAGVFRRLVAISAISRGYAGSHARRVPV